MAANETRATRVAAGHGVAVSALLALGMAMLLLACSPQTDGSSPSNGGEFSIPEGEGALLVELDQAAGRIVFPIDRYMLTQREMRTIGDAASAAVAVCAQAQGVDFHSYGLLYDPIYESEHFFGPWTVAQAEHFGFITPMTDADLRGNGYVDSHEAARNDIGTAPNSGVTDEGWMVVEECATAPDVLQFAQGEYMPGGPWEQELMDVDKGFSSLPEVQEIRGELVECYRGRGYEPDSDTSFVVAGFNPEELSEKQIELAVAVVECKNEIDATRRLAELMAAAQAPIVEKYADELAAQRQSIDETMVAAEEYIAAHPEAFFEW